jgi:hypothetical protein
MCEINNEVGRMRKYALLALLALGITVCLAGAAIMAFGEGLLGENHTIIAAVMGNVGIGLIGMSGAMSAAISAKRSSEETKSSTGGA